MAVGVVGDVNQITHDEWMDALREWDAKNDRVETDALYEATYGPDNYVQMYIVRNPLGITLKAAQPSEVDPSLERLSVLACIELTEKFLANYHFTQEFSDIGRIWKDMADRIYGASEQLPRIKSLIKDVQEMLAVLKLSEETTQKDCASELTRMKCSFVGLSAISLLQGTWGALLTHSDDNDGARESESA